MLKEFAKFPSLENTYRQKEIDKIVMMEIKDQWVVTEKVHGCFTHDTKISLSDGTIKKIGEIVNEKYDGCVLSVTPQGDIVESKIINWFDNGYSDDWLKVSIRIKNAKGSARVLTVTPNHEFFTKNGYTPIGELSVGDEVQGLRKSLSLNNIQQDILIGKMLGDGSLTNSSVCFGHTKIKEEYVDFTLKCLGDVAGNRQKDAVSGYGSTIARGRSISLNTIDDLFSGWDKSNGFVPKIKMTPFSLAFWYMDDGSIHINKKQRPRASFATCGFTLQSCENLLESLEGLGLSGSVVTSGGYNRITLDADSTELLFCMISPLVPLCMQYKLPEHFRNLNGGIGMVNYSTNEKETFLSSAEIVSIEKVSNSMKKYDIETEYHNYIANGIHVHNSNFSFNITEESVITKDVGEVSTINIRCAKRSGWIEDDEKFFNYRTVLEKYRDSLERLYYHLSGAYGYKEVVVFGELFGGNIQSGMCYPDEQDFIAFDLKCDGVARTKTTSFDILNSFGIPTTPIIGVLDSLEEALTVNESFNSLLIRDGFSGVDQHKEAEGVVIEPNTPVFEPNGSRVYLKKKTKRFLEKGGKPNIKHKVPMLLQESVQLKLDEALLFLNNNRFDSVVSKIGEVSNKDIGKVMGLLTQDIVVDMEKDLEQSVDLWFETKGEKQLFMKNLQKVVRDFVKPILLPM